MSTDYFMQELEKRLKHLATLTPASRRNSDLYKLLREHLKPLGHWKARPRGKPWQTGPDDRRPAHLNPKPKKY